MDENPPSDDVLPFRLKQSTFRLYESLISQAIKASPDAINFNPSPLRPTTAAARLRDAIISFTKFNWPNSLFTLAELEEAKLMVRHNDHNVVIGAKMPRGHMGGESRAFISPNHARLDGLPVDRIVSPDEIKAFCILLSSRLISGPVILRSQALDEATISALELNYDVAITVNESNHTLLI